MNKVGKVAQEPAAFGNGFTKSRDVQCLKVPQTTVQNTKPVRTCCATDLIALDNRSAQTSAARFEPDHQTVDTAADHDDIELFMRRVSGVRT